jgi:hypothetical protein
MRMAFEFMSECGKSAGHCYDGEGTGDGRRSYSEQPTIAAGMPRIRTTG